MSETPSDAPREFPMPPEYTWEPRVPLIPADVASPEALEAFARFKTAHRSTNNLILQLAQLPPAIDMERELAALPAHVTHIEKRVVEAMRLRVAVVCGCLYCMAWHTRFTEQAGYSQAEVMAICDLSQARPQSLDPDTQLAIALGHEMSTAVLSVETFDEAKARFGELGTIELIALAAAQNATSRMAAALKTPLEPAYARMLARKRGET